MKVKTIMLASCLLLLLGACNMFQEDCGMKGYLRAYVSDNVAPPTTEDIQVRYYDYYSGAEYTEKLGEPDYFEVNNQFLSRIATGEYKFLAYSLFNNKVRNAEELSAIEIYADTVNSVKYGIPIIANSQKLVYTDSSEGSILPEDTLKGI